MGNITGLCGARTNKKPVDATGFFYDLRTTAIYSPKKFTSYG